MDFDSVNERDVCALPAALLRSSPLKPVVTHDKTPPPTCTLLQDLSHLHPQLTCEMRVYYLCCCAKPASSTNLVLDGRHDMQDALACHPTQTLSSTLAMPSLCHGQPRLHTCSPRPCRRHRLLTHLHTCIQESLRTSVMSRFVAVYFPCVLYASKINTHTHTHTRARARTHAHTHTHALTHARTDGRTHTHLPTHPPILHFFSQGPGREGCHRRDAAPHESDEALRKTNATPLNG
jgi:hypothetical protein